MATGTVSFDAAITNLSDSFESLVHLVTGISYIIGIFLIAKGIMSLSVFGRQTMTQAQRGEMSGPMVWIFVGALLMYLPTTLDTSLTTVYGDSEIAAAGDIMAYAPVTAGENWEQLSNIIIKYVKLVGLIAFVRGWVILSKMGHSGAQPGSMGKGLTHVIGGVLLINVVETVNILATTFGVVGVT